MLIAGTGLLIEDPPGVWRDSDGIEGGFVGFLLASTSTIFAGIGIPLWIVGARHVPAGARARPDDDSAPVPRGYHLEQRRHDGLVIGGAVTFGAFYLPVLTWGAVNAAAGVPEGAFFFIPIAGPLIVSGFDVSPVERAVYVIDGVVQAAGVTMLVAGLATKRSVRVPDPVTPATSLRLMPTPMSFGRNSAGLGVVGTF